MQTTFKICRCCGTKANLRKRVCKVCGVPAIWDKPTAEQQAEHDAQVARRQATIDWLMGQIDREEMAAA